MYDIIRQVQYLDEFIGKDPILYKNINLKSFLIVHESLKYINVKKYSSIMVSLFRLIYEAYLLLPVKLFKVKERRNFNTINPIKYIFILSFEISDKRHSKILLDIINEVKDTAQFLIVSEKRDVFNYCKKNNLPCIFLRRALFSADKVFLKNDIHIIQKSILARVVENIQSAERILEHYSPKVILTTQDFWIFDQCFVQVARRMGILTITHQHGQIPNTKTSLYKYMFSDKIIVWGNGSKNLLNQYISDDKIVVLGTTKFNDLNPKQEYNRTLITIALNTRPKYHNVQLLENIISQLVNINELKKDMYNIGIKLHPSLEKNEYTRILKRISNKLNVEIPLFITTENNTEVLNRSFILLASNSTISLEGFICNVSTIEMDINEVKNKIFDNIPESIILIGNLSKEIVKRIVNKKYNENILLKQRAVLKEEIKSFNPIKDEMIFIEKYIKSKEKNEKYNNC